MENLDQLFRQESGRLVATLTRIFGLHNLALAEDVVQDAFGRAAEVWSYQGVPGNPAAWLMVTAKRRALDALRRERTARTFAPEVEHLVKSEWTAVATVDEAFSAKAIKDDVLRMMFTCCDPRLAEEMQVALILNILCGLSVGEIAAAYVSSEAAIEKRISRGKKFLADSKLLFDVAAPTDFAARLPSVLRALYLLFSEGYHGASPESVIRTELCREAMRLVAQVIEHPFGSTPAACALAALMCFDAARLPGRTDDGGALQDLARQDRSKWDHALIAQGTALLEQSAIGDEITAYHVEASIAAVHARAAAVGETDWREIVYLYDELLRIQPSPVVALNRAIAVAHAEGPERGLAEISAIPDISRLSGYPFHEAALGEFELRLGRHAAAREHFEAALANARNASEREFLHNRLRACLPQLTGAIRT